MHLIGTDEHGVLLTQFPQVKNSPILCHLGIRNNVAVPFIGIELDSACAVLQPQANLLASATTEHEVISKER